MAHDLLPDPIIATDPHPNRSRAQTPTWPLVWSDVASDPPLWIINGEQCAIINPDDLPCPRQPIGMWLGQLMCDRHWPANVPKPGSPTGY